MIGVEVYTCVSAPWQTLTGLEQALALEVARAVGRRLAFREATVIPWEGAWRSLDVGDYALAVGLSRSEDPEGGSADTRYRACVEAYLDTWSWLLARQSDTAPSLSPGVLAMLIR